MIQICALNVEPVTLDMKRRKPGILFISLQATSDYDVIVDFRVDSMALTTSFKKPNVMMI